MTMNGFGIRCGDAIRNVNKPLKIEINTQYFYDEIHYREADCLLTLSNSLERHMRKSPTYFTKEELSEEEFAERSYNRQSRFFIAKDKSEIIGYLEVANDGETFISEEPDYLHIYGAYLKEDYRGENIIQSLLSFVIETLKKGV